jgi:hypothetical protein
MDRVALEALYCGRGWCEAEAASRAANAGLLVVSAGLGLATASTKARPYNLTLSSGSPDDVRRKLGGGGAPDWWSALTGRSAFHVRDFDEGGLILAALSGTYLAMVAREWAGWPEERLARLRLFTKDAANLPARLRPCVMPYDDRLDAVGAGYAGTQGDFAQRALRHFADHFAKVEGDAADHAALVEQVLAPVGVSERPVRRRYTDDELVDLIGREWAAVGGRSAAMLRRLRRELNVACEQGRFKDLFRRAAQARAGVLL